MSDKRRKRGAYCLIDPHVKIGSGTIIKNYVELRRGTIIGKDCYIDSRVTSSGDCFIGEGVTIRYASIIAKGTYIADDVFISPQLMTENINHKGVEVGGPHIGSGNWNKKTRYRVFIGTNVTLAAGVKIVSGTIIGSKTNVRKNITEPGVYIGNPARRLT